METEATNSRGMVETIFSSVVPVLVAGFGEAKKPNVAECPRSPERSRRGRSGPRCRTSQQYARRDHEY